MHAAIAHESGANSVRSALKWTRRKSPLSAASPTAVNLLCQRPVQLASASCVSGQSKRRQALVSAASPTGRGAVPKLVPSAPTSKTWTDRLAPAEQQMLIKKVGTAPVQSNLCSWQLALWAAVRNKVTKTVPGEAAVETRSTGWPHSLSAGHAPAPSRFKPLLGSVNPKRGQ